jgi:hypothetical protein
MPSDSTDYPAECWDAAGKDTVVKRCLWKALPDKQEKKLYVDIIDDAVRYVSRVTRRGSLVALLTTLSTLDANDGRLPDDFFGSSQSSFFSQCFKFGHRPTGATRGKRKACALEASGDADGLPESGNQYIKNTLSDPRVKRALAKQQLERREGDSNLIVAASNEYSTNYFNHFDCFDRDINAALNILRVAGLGSSERPASLQRITRVPCGTR